MEYSTVAETAEKWGVTARQVQRLLAEGRIPQAKKYGRSWMLPADAEKPGDARRERNAPALEDPLSADLLRLLEVAMTPLPHRNPDAILKTVKEDSVRRQFEAELAYLRGDFARVMRCFGETDGDGAAKLRGAPVAVAAAVSLGDYPAYLNIESYLKDCVKAGKGGLISVFAELALASVYVSASAPKMVPGWLKEGDFGAFPPQLLPQYLHYLRTKYFLCVGRYETALAVAQTALAFGDAQKGTSHPDIYLRVGCALACHLLGREEEAKRVLLGAMRTALPHGFITPFAETVSDFGGLIEECVMLTYPACHDPLIDQWQRTVKNWVSFHNRFTQDNLSMILSRREFYLAQLVARRVPYAEIAAKYGISVGRLKNIMLEIYEKLCISGRDELTKIIGFYNNRGEGT
ncbi:MAG TPA: helix-turn-helix domain-containing protein [Candidatus Acidoferrum sp.]|nr:helix-turn-helix domain-containing protein [Candidatus Acidoferrum sp.]